MHQMSCRILTTGKYYARRGLKHATSPLNYATAVQTLNSLQSNASVIAQIRKHGKTDNEVAIPQMLEWVAKAGYSPKEFDKLNVIHVAGTKGKGSTSAFVSNILTAYFRSLAPSDPPGVGLYTSPHLRFVRERIQIDNEPLTESLFARYFYEMWNRFSATADGTKPMYFRFLTIMALHAYLKETVESAVIECGIGGEYDSTNIFKNPSVTAITSLGIDHEALLGRTIDEIAWHKSGIFKTGALALTVPQPQAAMKVLIKRALEKDVVLRVVGALPQIEQGRVFLGLAGSFQKINASLAATIASVHLRRLGHFKIPDLLEDPSAPLPEAFIHGLQSTKWPGRCEKRIQQDQQTIWYLDGAHTHESLQAATEWYLDEVSKTQGPRVLIFNQQTRDAEALIRSLFKVVSTSPIAKRFDTIIFSTNKTYTLAGYTPDMLAKDLDDSAASALTVQVGLAQVWTQMDPRTPVQICQSIEEAVSVVRSLYPPSKHAGQYTQVFVTGSLHFVGGMIDNLEKATPSFGGQ